MENRQAANFIHRKNIASTYDSICVRCSSTVATRVRESKLAADEEKHVCTQTGDQPLASHNLHDAPVGGTTNLESGDGRA